MRVGVPQVEHPVTEWISNVNIPACQLLIGMGVPLHRIPDIRRLFGCDINAASTIDFDEDRQVDPSGTSIIPTFRLSICCAMPLAWLRE